jgi:hypothetical protein
LLLWADQFAGSLPVRPMRPPHLISSVLWLVPIVVQAAIALVMLRRGLTKAFPIFFSYTVLVSARDFTLLLLPYAGNLYSTVFWWGDAAAILLSLGVILEVLWHLFRPYPFLRFVFRLVWIAALVATAFALLLLRADPWRADRLMESIILMERSARVLQVGLLIVLISLMSRLGLTWQHYSLGIAAGFGLYSALDLILLELRAHLHLITDNGFVFLRPAAYNFGILVWAFYFFRPQVRKLLDRLPSSDLANWNDTLTEQIDRWYRR